MRCEIFPETPVLGAAALMVWFGPLIVDQQRTACLIERPSQVVCTQEVCCTDHR
jgi:hypothetical protein